MLRAKQIGDVWASQDYTIVLDAMASAKCLRPSQSARIEVVTRFAAGPVERVPICVRKGLRIKATLRSEAVP